MWVAPVAVRPVADVEEWLLTGLYAKRGQLLACGAPRARARQPCSLSTLALAFAAGALALTRNDE